MAKKNKRPRLPGEKNGECAADGCEYYGPVYLFRKLYWCPIHLNADVKNKNGCKDNVGLGSSALAFIEKS
jgi:hypothetical protein